VSELLFQTPWWLPTLFAGVGLVLFISGNNRQERRIRNIGLACVGLGILVAVVSWLVDTDVEKVEKGSRRLVAAVEKSDWNTMRSLLDPKASVTVLNSIGVYNNRDDIIAGAQRAVDLFKLKWVHITSLDVKQTGSLMIATLDAFSDQEATGRPIPSSWQFEWNNSGGGWAVTKITNLRIANVTGDQARAQFPRP
jgi:hypothetical protein